MLQGYTRIGPRGATCVDGQWSPPKPPVCSPGKHPGKVYIFRGKRSADSQVIDSSDANAQETYNYFRDENEITEKDKDVLRIAQESSKVKDILGIIGISDEGQSAMKEVKY